MFNSIRKYFNDNDYPTNIWYRTHAERNYDLIILGDSFAKKKFNTDIESVKIWNMAYPKQTLRWDYIVLKHFYSILKPNGIVVFPIHIENCFRSYKEVSDKRPYYFDFMSYTFTHNSIGLFFIKVLKHLPLFMLYPNDWIRLLRGKKHLYDIKEGFEHHKRCKEDIAKTSDLVKEIQHFCEERSIRPVFVILSENNSLLGCVIETFDNPMICVDSNIESTRLLNNLVNNR